jgi:hypothetical protein
LVRPSLCAPPPLCRSLTPSHGVAGLAAILLFIEYEFGFRLAWKQAVAHRSSKSRKDKDQSTDGNEDKSQSSQWWRNLDLRQLW